MKVKGILKGTGIFIGGIVVGGMMFSNSDTENTTYDKETKTESVAKADTKQEVKKEVVKEVEKPKTITAQKIFEDSSVIASYYSIDNDVAKLVIENKLDKAIGIQDQTFGVNGFSTTSNTNSISITPHSKAILEIDLTEITGMYGTPSTIGGEISVFNNDTYDAITSIKFNNIKVTE